MEKIKICTGYKFGNKILKEMPADLSVYRQCQPIYKTFSGWADGYDKVKDYQKLPVNMKKYLSFIATELATPIEIVSIGPEREATILK